jgi:excisionase family DNA binding protein
MPRDLFSHPIPLLQTLYPGSFPEPLRPETRPETLPGALLTTDEAADYLGIAPETLRRLCRAKAITFIQPTPSEYRFALADLEEYINSRRNKRASGVR